MASDDVKCLSSLSSGTSAFLIITFAVHTLASPVFGDALETITLADAESVFDVKALTSTPLDARVLKTGEKDGIVTEEVMFHSEMDGTNRVDIFAFFSYPKGANQLPAFIWNQGGLAQAGTHFTEFGAKRGYATLCIDFPIPGYRSTGGYPINSGLGLTDDPKRAPIYHGAVALLKAVSFLQSRQEVDKERIGMAGSSWGGFYTTLMAGLDPRLKACSAMFGTGNAQLGNSWWDGGGRSAQHDAAYRERWRTTLDPALRLPRSKTRIGWFTGTNDGFYWMPAVMATYAAAGGNKHLTLVPNWDHGLPPVGDEQVFAWLDAHLKGGPKFVEVTDIQLSKSSQHHFVASFTYNSDRHIKSADWILSYGEDGNWSSRYWIQLPAEFRGGRCQGSFKPGETACWLGGAVTDDKGFRYSTPLVKVDAKALGIATASDLPDYNGCSEWGSFEPEQIFYLKALAHMDPTTSTDAKEGKQSCVLKARTEVKPLYFTAGLLHRFTCYVKADADGEVKVALMGEFDGQPKVEEKTFRIGKHWTELRMDYLPPRALSARLGAVFTLPDGATALLDCVEFRPVKEKNPR